MTFKLPWGAKPSPNGVMGPVYDFAAHPPVAHQHAPTRWRPTWLVHHLVYQGGNPKLKASSLTGGGFIPARQWAGKYPLFTQPYATPISSAVGGGQVPARPNFITALMNGQINTGT
jgi:hypothetical protein